MLPQQAQAFFFFLKKKSWQKKLFPASKKQFSFNLINLIKQHTFFPFTFFQILNIFPLPLFQHLPPCLISLIQLSILIPNCALLPFFLTFSLTFDPWFCPSLPLTVILFRARPHCFCSSQLKKVSQLCCFLQPLTFSVISFFPHSYLLNQIPERSHWLKFHGPFLPTRKNYSKLTCLCQQFTLKPQKQLIWSQLLLNQ